MNSDINLPFPFSNRQGLLSILHDPDMWASCITSKDLRHEIKHASKKAFHTRILSVTDNHGIGVACVNLLASPRGREVLRSLLVMPSFDVSKICRLLNVMALCLATYAKKLYADTSSLEKENQESYNFCAELSIAGFQEWLLSHDVEASNNKAITLFGCAIAILNPSEAKEIADLLSKCIEDFSLLSKYSTYIQPLEAHTNVLEKDVDIKRDNIEGVESDRETSSLPDGEPLNEEKLSINFGTWQVSHDVPVDALLTMLTAPSDWKECLTLSQWREAVNLLNKRAQEEKDELDQLEQLVENVNRDANAAKSLPWWREPLDLEDEIFLREDATANTETTRFSNLQHDLARLMRAHGRYEALLTRTNQTPETWLTGAKVPLGDLAEALEERAFLLGERLEQLGQSINRANSLLDELIVGDALSAVRLVSDLTADATLELAKFIFDPEFDTDATRERRVALRDFELGGLLLAHIFPRDECRALDCVRLLISPFQEDNTDLKAPATVLAWLNFDKMQHIAATYGEIAPIIALLIFAAAIKQERPALLNYIEPLLQDSMLDSTSRDFFRNLCICRQRGHVSSLGLELRRASALIDNSRAAEQVAEQLRRKILEFIDLPPGMKKTFHRLRVYARLQFLEPLRSAIERKDPRSAEETWISFGELDTMVDACINHLKKTDHPEPRHYEQTRNYLEDFQDRLNRWVRIASGMKSASTPELRRAIESLRSHAPLSLTATALLRMMEHEEMMNLLPDDFGERVSQDLKVKIPAEMRAPFLRPTMLSSWPSALEGDVSLSNVLADSLREKLVNGGIQLDQAVESYITAGYFEAARRAADQDIGLLKRVQDALVRSRDLIKNQNADVLSEAASIKELDTNVAEYLTAADCALGEGDFDEAIAAIGLLRECIADFRNRNQPARAALIEVLEEAGVNAQDRASVEEIEVLLGKVRQDNVKRRRHILALEEAASHKLASEPVQILWPDAAKRFDRPAFWPNGETSGLLSEALKIIERKLRGKWNNRLGESDPSTTIVRRVAEWTLDQLGTRLQAGEEASETRLLELADLLEEGGGDAALLRFLGESPVFKAVAAPLSVVQPEVGPAEQQKATPEPAMPTLSVLTRMVDNEPLSEVSDLDTLRKAARSADWARARALAVGQLKSDKRIDVDRRLDLLAIYGVARFFTENPSGLEAPLWLGDACIAVAASRRLATYYLGDKTAREFIPAAVLSGLPQATQRGGREASYEQFGRVIEAIAAARANAPEYLWMADLFRRSSGVAPRLATYIWESFTGFSRNEHYRCALLQLLFRCRQQEALRTLATQVPERVKRLVRTTLDAFAVAEAQPEARAAALQLSAALRDQASGVANTKPWILFFHSLQTARDLTETNSLDLALDSEVVFEESPGVFSVDLRIKPSLYAPPERLILTVGSRAAMPLCDDAVFKECVVRVPLPDSVEFSAHDECSLPWRLEGQTIMGQKITLAGTWTLHRERPAFRLSNELIDRYWPGAKCEPVKRDQGFFGREKEIKLIESYLSATPRPRSVMVFGERRIGKTSLLKALILGMPPSPGRICGAFCDVSGLRTPGPGEGLSRLFFRKILAALENRDDNQSLLDTLETHQGHQVSIARLGRNLDPDTSLFTALTTFVERLEKASGGLIKRLALFIDEFDRFAAPLLLHEREQVGAFLWELREVVQRSERIAFVLAGSGIQRLLKENYQDALYGSIAEVHLPRFQWATEHEAIFDTFLPQGLRDRLCRPAEAEQIAKYAAQLCGGHPMFLALLGRTTAALADGRYITTGLLERVVEKIVSTDAMHQPSGLDRKVFYECVFQSLEVLTKQEFSLAKGLFVTLSELTTPSDPRFASYQVSSLFDASGLRQFTDTSQLLQALDKLTKVGAIVNDNARVKISVPLSAAAVRQDAMLLREDVINTLQKLSSQ